MLIECVLGALGLAIDQATSDPHSTDQRSQLQDKTDQLKQVLERRLAALTKRRRRIEVLKIELATVSGTETDEYLAVLEKHEQAYQRQASALKRGRRKLARWQHELRLMKASAH